MFRYSEKTQVNVPLELLKLFKTIKADKSIKSDASNVIEVKLTNTLSPTKTNLEATDIVKEIYIVDIYLQSNNVPNLFLESFNKSISFQTLFRLHYRSEVKYICSIKIFEENKVKVLKTYESDWKKEEILDFPTTTKLENVFKEMLKYVTGYAFRQDEEFEKYVERLGVIKRQKLEIERVTKLMNAEKQPNIKMNMNDRIKQMKKELFLLEE